VDGFSDHDHDETAPDLPVLKPSTPDSEKTYSKFVLRIPNSQFGIKDPKATAGTFGRMNWRPKVRRAIDAALTAGMAAARGFDCDWWQKVDNFQTAYITIQLNGPMSVDTLKQLLAQAHLSGDVAPQN
jgi:hypothetical protein